MTVRATDPVLARIAEHLSVRGDGSFGMYREGCFRRRIEVRMRARGLPSLDDYAALLEREPAEVEELASVVPVGVTSFFRNPAAWRRLEALLANEPEVRTGWSAGCSTGEEAYSLAFLLARRSAATWRVDGTDLDRDALLVARAGRYPARSADDIGGFFAGVPSTEWGRHQGNQFEVDDQVRRGIQWSAGNLTDEWLGPVRYDVVVCRNVLIYFGTEGQRRVLTTLTRALRRGGLLFLGKTELALGAEELGIEPVDLRERIYRRAA